MPDRGPTAWGIDGIRAVAKTSSLDFARAAVDAWQSEQTFVALDDAAGDALPLFKHIPVENIAAGGGWFEETIALDTSPKPAQISFSSGTTGQPKPILISRRAISDTSQRLIDVMAMDSTIREYIGVPLTYSFGLGRLRAVAAIGGRSFLPANGFRIDEFAAMLAAGEVNALSAVPTLLRLIIQQRAKFAQAGGKLRWLEIGSQFMAAEEKAAIAAIFPQAKIVQHYGLTEASRTTFLRIDGAAHESLAGVGKPTGDVRIRIDDSGRICISGPHLADGVLTHDAIVPTAGADGWLQTSDLGEIREGDLHFLGRADDLINVSGVKVPAGFFEQELLEEVGDSAIELAVAGAPDPLRGELVVVAFIDGIDPVPLQAAVDAMVSRWKLTASDVQLLPVDALPRTETGKVQRREIGRIHEARRAAAHTAQHDAPAESDTLRAFYQSLSPRAEINAQSSFASLKGDSLSYVQATIIIEDALGSLPPGWEALTLGELEAMRGAPGTVRMRGWRVAEGEMVSRTFAITVISASHAWWPDRLIGTSIAGGSTILLLIFGINLFRFRSNTLFSSRPFTVVGSIFLRYILPYYAIIALFSLKDGFDWRNAALIGTFFDGPSGSLHMYWFFETLLALTIIITGIFYIAPLRRILREKPAIGWFGLLAAAIALRFGVDAVRPDWGLSPRTPDAFLYLAIGGMAIAALTSQTLRIAVAVILVATLVGTAGLTSWPVVLSIGLVPILFLPQVSLPTPIAMGVRAIASSTIYIYLCSRIVMAISRGPLHGLYPPLEFLATLATGVAIGAAVRNIEAIRARRRRREQPDAAPASWFGALIPGFLTPAARAR